MVGSTRLSGLTLAVGLGVAVTSGHGVAVAETPEGGGDDPGLSSGPPADRSGPVRDRQRPNRILRQRLSALTTGAAEGAGPATQSVVQAAAQPVAQGAIRPTLRLRPLISVPPGGVTAPTPPAAPAGPIRAALELVFAARRRIEHRLFNRTPTPATTVVTGQDRDTGVVKGRVAADRDGDKLTYKFVEGKEPQHGTVVFDDHGGYVYTPDETWAHTTAGDDGFTVTVSDRAPDGWHLHLLSPTRHEVTVPVSFTVSKVNRPPTVNAKLLDTGDGGPVKYEVTTSDPDPGDGVAVTWSNDEAKGKLIKNTDGTYTYAPDAGYAHGLYGKPIPAGADEDAITFTGTDPYGKTGVDVETVKITPINRPPTVSAQLFGVDSNGGVTYRVTSADPDAGDLVTLVVLTDSSKVDVTGGGGLITITPKKEYAHGLTAAPYAPGVDDVAAVTFSVKDQFGAEGTAGKTVTITPVNAAPTLTVTVPATPNPDGKTVFTIAAGDSDGDTVHFNVTKPANGSFDVPVGDLAIAAGSSKTITFTPDAGSSDLDYAFVGSDQHGKTATATVTLAGAPVPVNQPPQVTVSGPSTLNPTTGARNYTVTAIGPEVGDDVRLTKPPDTEHVTFTMAGNVITATPDYAYAHSLGFGQSVTESFNVTATDEDGLVTSAPFNVKIDYLNKGPEANVAFSLDNATSKTTAQVQFTDPDGDRLLLSGTYPEGLSDMGTFESSFDAATNTYSFSFTPSAIARAAAAPNGLMYVASFTASDGSNVNSQVIGIRILPPATTGGPGIPGGPILPPVIPDLPPRTNPTV